MNPVGFVAALAWTMARSDGDDAIYVCYRRTVVLWTESAGPRAGSYMREEDADAVVLRSVADEIAHGATITAGPVRVHLSAAQGAALDEGVVDAVAMAAVRGQLRQLSMWVSPAHPTGMDHYFLNVRNVGNMRNLT